MAAQKGRELLLKIGNNDGPPETFTTLGGLRSTTFTINNEVVDITNKDSSGIRELLDGGGTTSFSISGTGVFKDDTSYANAETYCRTNAIHTMQLVDPDFIRYEGEFLIASLERGGEHNGETNYSITLENSGTVSATTI